MLIKKLGDNRIVTILEGNSVTLDFNPLLTSPEFKSFFSEETKPFLLAHWNKVLALPAYFCPLSQNYFARKESKIIIRSWTHFWLGVERSEVLPSSCLLYPQAQMEVQGDFLIIFPA